MTEIDTDRARLLITDGRVEKRQGVDVARWELNATKVGAVIGKRSGLFSVPTILSDRSSEGLIVFQRIADVDSLRQALPIHPDPASVISQCARSLLAIHREKVGSSVFVHGDFTVDNILYDFVNDKLVIIDWSLPVWLRENSSHKPIEDVCLFLMSLFNRPVFYSRRIESVANLATCFLSNYYDGRQFEQEELVRVSDSLLGLYLPSYRRSVWWRYLANYPSMIRFRRFVNRADLGV